MSFSSRRRRAARVVVLDQDDRVFLIKSNDPANPRARTWWEIPGGGMDPGETSAETAARELREEAGITSATMGPVVWTQSVQFTFAGMFFDQDEFIHVAWTDQKTFAPTQLETFEAMAFQGSKWWTVDELANSDEEFLPPRLPALVPDLVSGQIPDHPIDITPS